MREIKFRAWDTGNSIWQYFTIEDLCLMSEGFYKFLENWCQYTGLKDKNGKEIYEGDLVVYETDEYGFHSINKEPELVESLQAFFEDKGLCEGEYGCDHTKIQVIGNIYENPELLKGGLDERHED